MSWSYPIVIREFHLDTFGHVNNATYLSLYEEARWELITQNGYGLKEIKQLKKGPIILEAKVKYLKEIQLRERIQITVESSDFNKKIGIIRQKMIKPDGSIASEAEFTYGLFDTIERKLITPTPEWIKAIQPPAS